MSIKNQCDIIYLQHFILVEQELNLNNLSNRTDTSKNHNFEWHSVSQIIIKRQDHIMNQLITQITYGNIKKIGIQIRQRFLQYGIIKNLQNIKMMEKLYFLFILKIFYLSFIKFIKYHMNTAKRLTSLSHLELDQILKKALYGFKIQESDLIIKSQAIYDPHRFLNWGTRLKDTKTPQQILQNLEQLLIEHIEKVCNCENLDVLSFNDYLDYFYKLQDQEQTKCLLDPFNKQKIENITQLAIKLGEYWSIYNFAKLLGLKMKSKNYEGKPLPGDILKKIDFLLQRIEISYPQKDKFKKCSSKQEFFEIIKLLFSNFYTYEKLQDIKLRVRPNPLIKQNNLKINFLLKSQLIKEINKIIQQINKNKNYQEQVIKKQQYQEEVVYQNNNDQEKITIWKKHQEFNDFLIIFKQRQSWKDKYKTEILQLNKSANIKTEQDYYKDFIQYVSSLYEYQSKIYHKYRKNIELREMIYQIQKTSYRHRTIQNKLKEIKKYNAPSKKCQNVQTRVLYHQISDSKTQKLKKKQTCNCYIQYLLNQGVFIDQIRQEKFTQEVSNFKNAKNQLQGAVKINIPQSLQWRLKAEFDAKFTNSATKSQMKKIEGTKKYYGYILLKKQIFKKIIAEELQDRYEILKQVNVNNLNQHNFEIKKIANWIFQIYGEILPTKCYVGKTEITQVSQENSEKDKTSTTDTKLQVGYNMFAINTSMKTDKKNNQKNNMMSMLKVITGDTDIIYRQNFRITLDYTSERLQSIIQQAVIKDSVESKTFLLCGKNIHNKNREVINLFSKNSIYQYLFPILQSMQKTLKIKFFDLKNTKIGNKSIKVKTYPYELMSQMINFNQEDIFFEEQQINAFRQSQHEKSYIAQLKLIYLILLQLISQNNLQQHFQPFIKQFNKLFRLPEKKAIQNYLVQKYIDIFHSKNIQAMNSILHQLKQFEMNLNFYDCKIQALPYSLLQQIKSTLNKNIKFLNDHLPKTTKTIINFQQKEKELLAKKKEIQFNLIQIEEHIKKWQTLQVCNKKEKYKIIQSTTHKLLKVIKNKADRWQKFLQNLKKQQKNEKTKAELIEERQGYIYFSARMQKFVLKQCKQKQFKNQIQEYLEKIKNDHIEQIIKINEQIKKLQQREKLNNQINSKQIQLANSKDKLNGQSEVYKTLTDFSVSDDSKVTLLLQKHHSQKNEKQCKYIQQMTAMTCLRMILKINKYLKRTQLLSTQIKASNLKKKVENRLYSIRLINLEFKQIDGKQCILGKWPKGQLYVKLVLLSKIPFLVNLQVHKNMEIQIEQVEFYQSDQYQNPLYLNYVECSCIAPSKLRFMNTRDLTSIFYLIEYNEEYEYNGKEETSNF